MELTPIEQMAKVSVAQIILRRRMRNSMNRLISEQAVIEAIKEWASHMFTTPTGDLLKLIKAIPSAEPKWIPVSERLPKKNVEVLATTIWDAVTIAEMFSANDWFIHEGTTNAETDEIVAWMPLPTPYEPQESEDENDGR